MRITYDPLLEMEKKGKKYGYAVGLWEVGRKAPSLFRLASEYRILHHAEGRVWNAMVAPWMPWPLRYLMRWIPYCDSPGDAWNMCHYWSNFEIADLDFFRSQQYCDFFDHRDENGGFYYERVRDPLQKFEETSRIATD